MASEGKTYTRDEIAHAADLEVPLQHGYFRYTPAPDATPEIREVLAPKNDKPFIYVPQGFTQRDPKSFEKILSALDLDLPNFVITVAATEGTQEEQVEKCYEIRQQADSHPVAKDWSDEHRKEVLVSRVRDLLLSTMESSAGVGAWILPQAPRRRNGAAQMICRALPKTDSPAVCLGLIGLDSEDEAEGLKDAITSAMQPVGSPVREVTRLVFDPTVKDQAPCPQLSHVLFFESPHELKAWREKLLATIPDFLLAFGDLTKPAFESVFEAVVEGSPVVLLKHTSPDIDNLCLMFNHAKHFFEDHPSEKVPAPSATQKKGTRRLPQMEGMDDEQIRLFISTWPLDYNPATTLCADPFLLTPAMYQKRSLAAISAAFDLKKGSSDFQKVRKSVLDYAWSFYNVAQVHANQKKKATESLHLRLLAFTLVSVIASIVYDQLYSGSRSPQGKVQMLIFVSTILLPLYVTSLKQESDKSNPISKWSAFRVATAKLESEIFKFRCQVAPYRADEKNEASMRKTVTAFTNKTRSIWASIQKHLTDDGMSIPDDFWSEGSPLVETEEAKVMTGEALSKAVPAIESPSDETTALLAEIPTQEKVIEEDEEDPDELIGVDDHYSPLKIDDYVELRMNGTMGEAVTALDVMVIRNAHVSNAIKFITILSGGAAALSMQWMVPIILAVTAGLGSGQEFRQYPKRIDLANQGIVRLNDLKLWWMGLSMYERQLPKNKDRLIHESERIILHRCISEYGGTEGED
jgi:hypothetical protein